jgi:hypothetical protein
VNLHITQPWRRRRPPTQLNGYVSIAERKAGFGVQWRWKDSKVWKAGSVHTRDEANALAARLRASIAAGEEPEELPHYKSTRNAALNGPATAARSKQELEDAHARIAKIIGEPERCVRCHLLKPCDPCIPALRRHLREARRGEL